MTENKELYSYLVKNEGFYMKQYFSDVLKEDKWICIRNVNDGLYAVITTKDSSEDINIKEAVDYLNSLGMPFRLNVVVITNGAYITGANSNVSRLVYNIKNNEIILNDRGTEPLLSVIKFLNEDKKNNQSKIKEYPITWILIIANIVIFAITAIISKSLMEIDTRVLVEFGAKQGYLIKSGQAWRLVTAAFLHGGLMHIVVNMYSLFAIGPVVEKVYAWKKYLGIYFFSAITSSYLSYKLDPGTISVGASGAIFGILGAILVFAIKEKDNINKGFIGNIVSVIILNLFIGFSTSNIDNYGHIGGFIGGVLISLLLYKKREVI